MEKFFLCSARTLILTKPSLIYAEKIEKLFFMYFSESIKIQNLCFNLNLVAHSSITMTFIDGYVTLNNFTLQPSSQCTLDPPSKHSGWDLLLSLVRI